MNKRWSEMNKITLKDKVLYGKLFSQLKSGFKF